MCLVAHFADTGSSIRAAFYQYTSIPIFNYEIVDSADILNQRKLVTTMSLQINPETFNSAVESGEAAHAAIPYLYAVVYKQYNTALGTFNWDSAGTPISNVYTIPQNLLACGELMSNLGPSYINIPNMKVRPGDQLLLILFAGASGVAQDTVMQTHVTHRYTIGDLQ